MFLSTADAEEIGRVLFACGFTDEYMPEREDSVGVMPYLLYGKHWNIEVGFYEMNTFWDMGRYMMRRKEDIESLLNLILIFD